jgi:hypothetical protein
MERIERAEVNLLYFGYQLTHVEYYGIECHKCHHDYRDGGSVWEEGDPVKKCVVCHNPKKKQGKMHRLVFAFQNLQVQAPG